jgi:2Fe-2S ferredoxin
MPKVRFILTTGEVQEVDAPLNATLLEVARQYNIDLEGACEGSLACSTCHVVVHPDWYDKLELETPDEGDMLDLAFGLTKTSRLGCQIRVTEELDGLTVTIPQETRHLFVK